MKLVDTRRLPVPRDAAWAALNDPAILRRSLPGCDRFEPDGDGRYAVAITASVGPIRARFSGRLTLSALRPPESYAMTFEGSGGAAGFGKGTARVALADAPGGTDLAYEVEASVGGKLAQVGARLIDGVAQRLADDFFDRFERTLADAREASGDAIAAPATSVPTSAPVVASTPAIERDVAQRSVSPPTSAPASPEARHVALVAAGLSVLGACVSVLAALVVVLAIH